MVLIPAFFLAKLSMESKVEYKLWIKVNNYIVGFSV